MGSTYSINGHFQPGVSPPDHAPMQTRPTWPIGSELIRICMGSRLAYNPPPVTSPSWCYFSYPDST